MYSKYQLGKIQIEDLVDEAVTNAIARRQQNSDLEIELSDRDCADIRGGTGIAKLIGVPTLGIIYKDPEYYSKSSI